MVERLKVFDAAEFLETDEDRRIFLEDSFESGDPAVILNALSIVARSRNVSELARQAGITREGFYRALNGGNPTLDTITKIASVMGYRWKLEAIGAIAAPARKAAAKKPAVKKPIVKRARKAIPARAVRVAA